MLPILLRRTGRSIWDSPFDFASDDLNRALTRWCSDTSDDIVGSYPMDIHEDDQHIYVDAELPGFTKDQVQVTLENQVLSITAQRKAKETKGETHLSERRFTRVARSFTLPNKVDENKVKAHLDHGVLHLVLDKQVEVQPRRIEVK